MLIFYESNSYYRDTKREIDFENTQYNKNLITFDPNSDQKKVYSEQSQELEQQITHKSTINIDGFIENVVKLYQQKLNHKTMSKTFKSWLKLYYDRSIRAKTFELEVRKKQNFRTVSKYFTLWRRAIDKRSQSQAFQHYLYDEYRNTPSSFSNVFNCESRITKYENAVANQQESGAMFNDTRNQQVFQSDTLGSYPVKNLNDQYSPNIFENNTNQYPSDCHSSELRKPYISNIETVESIDLPCNKLNHNPSITSSSNFPDSSTPTIPLSFNQNAQNCSETHNFIPQTKYSYYDYPSYQRAMDMPLKSVQVLNHKSKKVVCDSLEDQIARKFPRHDSSDSDSDRSENHAHMAELTAIPMQNSLRNTLSLDMSTITYEQKLHVLRKVFLNW